MKSEKDGNAGVTGAVLSEASLRVLRGFSRENDGSFRCNKEQANDLARAIQEALALLGI